MTALADRLADRLAPGGTVSDPRLADDEEAASVAAARRGDDAAFRALVERYRVEIRAHCYRMLGSLQDAEDATQEVMVRAWRHLPGFEGRSSVRTWLYRIATNVCLTALERRPTRRLAPQEAVEFAPTPDRTPTPGVAWIDPFPDVGLDAVDPAPGPDAVTSSRDSVRLAFVAALQHLSPRQRAALLLRDVLGYAPAEIAALLETSTASVNSALQRARETVRERRIAEPIADPDREREVVRRFVDRWAAGDWDGVAAVLAEDVLLTMPPFGQWFRGPTDAIGYVSSVGFDDAGTARLVPISANGLPGLACYLADDDGRDACIGVMLLQVADDRVAEIIAYPGADPVPFGAPRFLDTAEERP